MRAKVYKKDLSNGGDCLRASICSLFGLIEYHVPNFMNSDDWREKFVDYMRSKNMGVISFPVTSVVAMRDFQTINRFVSFQCIAIVMPIEQNESPYAVVGRVTDGVIEIIHDPSIIVGKRSTDEYSIREIFVFFRSF